MYMSLKCPRTNTPLKEVELDGVVVNISEACGGVWFDNFEIKKFDEIHEKAGDKLVEILAPFQNKSIDEEKRMHCPKCKDIILMRHFESPKRAFKVDECAQCAGIWLDPGELAQLRSLFKTEEQRKAYVEKFVNSTLSPHLETMRQLEKHDLDKSKRMAGMFKFITPSQYIKK